MRQHRAYNELREIKITRNYIKHADGSVLVEFGNTKVICTASITSGVPKFLKGMNQGWLSAEYSMLPKSTLVRTEREAVRGKQTGRTQEIQRLIGRSLRSIVDLNSIGENTILIDCDVIQADGGTRTASITGGAVALIDAVNSLQQKLKLTNSPIKQLVAAVSVGIYGNNFMLDLDYTEDCSADTDMNIVITEDGNFIEIQGTAEKKPFTKKELDDLLGIAQIGINQLFKKQRQSLQQQ